MTKLCSVCGTENREEAQFCRSCGTAFSTQLPRAAAGDDASQLNVCSECGFQNKPGLRYCANCGMSLAAGAAATDGGVVGTGSPPPLSYPSFAPVAPYPPAPPVGDDAIPDLPDPDAEIALRQQEAADTDGAAMPFEAPPSRGRAPIVIGGIAVALVVAGALAWTYMRGSDPSPPAIGATTPPVAPTVPASAAAAPIIVEPAPASAPAAVAAPASTVETPPTAAAPIDTPPPAAARPLPQVGDAVPPESAADEAKRVAAERRAKAAREKAERDAKASATDREQSAAAAQREQEAQARRRADDAQRARPTPTPPPAAATAQGRTVREMCAGRGTIAEAVCQSRACGQPEHANEPICRQLREQDERRRNFGG